MGFTSSVFSYSDNAPRHQRSRWCRSVLMLTLLTCGWLALGAAIAAQEPVAETPSAQAYDFTRRAEAAYQFSLAKLLTEESSFEEARQAYELALELGGSDLYARLELAKFYVYLAQISRGADTRFEQLGAAAEQAGIAYRQAPENPDVLRVYAQIHLQLAERQVTSADLAEKAFSALREKTEGDLQVLTSLGQIYLWKGEAAKAAEVLQEAVAVRPGHRMLNAMLVDALMAAGEGTQATEALGQLVEADPESLDNRLKLADLYSESGDYRSVVELLRATPEPLRSSPSLRRRLALALHRIGENAEALLILDDLWAEQPDQKGPRPLRVQVLSALTRYDEALAELRPLVEGEFVGEGGPTLDSVLMMSRLLERTGRYDEAAGILHRQPPATGEDDALRLTLALAGVLERQGKADEAISLLSERAASSPSGDLTVLGRALGEMLQRADRTPEAIDVLEDAVKRLEAEGLEDAADHLRLRTVALLAAGEDRQLIRAKAPRYFGVGNEDVELAARFVYAEALAANGEIDLALEQLGPAHVPASQAQQALAQRIEILFDAGREEEAEALVEDLVDGGERNALFAAQILQRSQRYAEMIPLLEPLVADDQESPIALFLLGSARERTGERGAAIATFERLLEVMPDHAPTLNYLGYMWAERGEQLDRSLALVQRAVALDPDNGAYVDSLGWVYFRLGRYEEARSHLEWAARLVPSDATIFEHLGDLYTVLEEHEQARANYRQAVALSGDNLEAVRAKLERLDAAEPGQDGKRRGGKGL